MQASAASGENDGGKKDEEYKFFGAPFEKNGKVDGKIDHSIIENHFDAVVAS